MVSIPLSVYTSTESTRVARKEFFQGDSSIEVGRAAIRKDTGEVIHSTDVVRMAQATNGVFVPLSDDEVAAATSPKGLAEVISFVPIKDFDNYLTEGLYQVRPKREKGKANQAIEQAFAMLLAGMKARKVGALIKVAMRGPARYAILTTDGDLLLVLPADGVREPLPIHLGNLSKAEVAMATALIDAIGIGAPVVTDDTAPVLQAFVDAKAAGMPAPAAIPVAPIDNLMAAFEASIEAAKKNKAA
jgi:non-homologous end joining protein Ku